MHVSQRSAWAALVVCIVSLGATTAQAQRSKPNIIIALSDDLSANEFPFLNDDAPGVNGAETPALRRMARQGVAFTTGWSQPICSPTRGSLVTGLYAQTTGWFDNDQRPTGEENSLARRFGTFANLANNAGYETLIAGKWQMVSDVAPYKYKEACLWRESDNPVNTTRKLRREFDGPRDPEGKESRFYYPMIVKDGVTFDVDENDYGPNIVFDCVHDFIRRQKAANKKFFVYMPLLLPHRGYDFDTDTNGWPPPPRLRNGVVVGRGNKPATLKSSIEYHDLLMGRLMRFVKSQGLRRDTITFYMGDNGSHNNGKGQVVQERGTRVPFIVHGPSRVRARFLSSEFVSVVDIFNTVRSLMGAAPLSIARPHSVDFSKYLLGRASTTGRAWLYAYRKSARIIRYENYILDGLDNLYLCATPDDRTCERRPDRLLTDAEKELLVDLREILCRIELQRPVDMDKLKQPGASCA